MTTSKKKQAARAAGTLLKKKPAATQAAWAPVPWIARPYEQVIEVISSRTHDSERMLTWIAKNEPEVFLRAHTASALVVSKDWARAVVQHLVDGNKVSAIKATRERTGLGLKEAKDICDKVHEMLPIFGFKSVNPLSFAATAVIPAGANQIALQELLNAAKAMRA